MRYAGLIALGAVGGLGPAMAASAGVPYQPDLWMMRKGGHTIVGSDVHNGTGVGQTANWRMRAGGKVIYTVWLENDGAHRDSLRWTGTVSDANFTIAYYSQSGAGDDITPQVTGAGFTTRELGPGISKLVHIVIRSKPGAPVGAHKTFRLTLASTRRPTVKDVVRVMVRVKETPTAAQITGLAGLPTAGGAQVTFGLSAPAEVSAQVLNLAGRPLATLGGPRECAAGTNVLLWNGRDGSGLAVPNGTYLVEVTARAAKGAEVRATTTVRLRR